MATLDRNVFGRLSSETFYSAFFGFIIYQVTEKIIIELNGGLINTYLWYESATFQHFITI